MIIEVPSSVYLKAAGINGLNLAWSIVIGLLSELENAEVRAWDDDGSAAAEYWRNAQGPLSNALTLVQQGQELLVKGRIAAVSPFLLLSKDVREWPASDKKDVAFSELRSVDAADLPKLHNSVSAELLSDDFIDTFNLVRRRRNQIIHHGKDTTEVRVPEMLEMILASIRHLAPGVRWMKQRVEYLSNDHLSAAYSSDHVRDSICAEAECVIRELPPARLKALLSFDKKARRYLCPDCNSNVELTSYKVAHLRPNTPKGTQLYCLACDEEYKVQRIKCVSKECPSNVISSIGVCLTCWTDQYPSD